jgi:hypothetical protein
MVQTGFQNLPATGIECNMIIPPWKVNQSKQFPDAPLLVSTQSLVVSLAYLLSKSKLADEVFAQSHIVEPKSELARSAAELLSKRDGAQSGLAPLIASPSDGGTSLGGVSSNSHAMFPYPEEPSGDVR